MRCARWTVFFMRCAWSTLFFIGCAWHVFYKTDRTQMTAEMIYDFYHACKNDDVAYVNRLLDSADNLVGWLSREANCGLRCAIHHGSVGVVALLLKDRRVDPAFSGNCAIQRAAERGRLPVIELLLNDTRVDPSADCNIAIRSAVSNQHFAVVERLIQDRRVDPSVHGNCILQHAAAYGRLSTVEQLLKDVRVDPSDGNNFALRVAVANRHFRVADRLLEDTRTDFTVVLKEQPRDVTPYFEYRPRFTEICIALQSMHLPAWITMLIIKAAFPWTTLPIHARWSLVCAVKHFHDK